MRAKEALTLAIARARATARPRQRAASAGAGWTWLARLIAAGALADIFCKGRTCCSSAGVCILVAQRSLPLRAFCFCVAQDYLAIAEPDHVFNTLCSHEGNGQLQQEIEAAEHFLQGLPDVSFGAAGAAVDCPWLQTERATSRVAEVTKINLRGRRQARVLRFTQCVARPHSATPLPFTLLLRQARH